MLGACIKYEGVEGDVNGVDGDWDSAAYDDHGRYILERIGADPLEVGGVCIGTEIAVVAVNFNPNNALSLGFCGLCLESGT